MFVTRFALPRPRRGRRSGLATALLALAFVHGGGAHASAQEPPLILQRASGPLKIDGVVDEPAWIVVPPLPVAMSGPRFGVSPSEPTEIRVAYDDAFLYFSGVFTAEPGAIRSRSLTRDRWGDGDLFEVVVDGYDDNETGTGFATNPAGARIDFAISHDAEGGGDNELNPPVNRAWNAPWTVATTRTEEGWSAEMRIPLSTLRFQPNADGTVVMGLLVRRYIAHRNEEVTFPAIPESWSGGYRKPSLARAVQLQDVQPSRPLFVTPYILAGQDRQPAMESAGFSSEATREIGADLKVGLADNLVLDLTANTDFAQAEADAFQVNLSRFNLFYPEKRSFFLERAGVFDFRTRGDDRLFHSRRIGLGPEGQPVRVLAGGRLVGRVGDWDLGTLDIQTAETALAPSENFGVLRARRRIVNDNSFAGGMFTSRLAAGAPARLAYGLDASLYLGASTYLSASFAQAANGAAPDLGSSAGLLSLSRRSRVGFGHSHAVSWNGPEYDPAVGFVGRRGVLIDETSSEFAWRGSAGSPIQRIGPTLQSVLVVRDRDRGVESLELAPGWAVTWKSGLYASVEANLYYEHVGEPLALGHATIPVGHYWFRSARVFLSLPATRTFSTRVYFRKGAYYDGDWTLLILNPYVQLSERLQLGLDLQRTRATFPGDRVPFDPDLIRLRADLALNPRLSASALLQYTSTEGEGAANVRLRYNFGEGRDIYLVYNEGLSVPDGLAWSAVSSQGRTVVGKVTYAFAVPFS